MNRIKSMIPILVLVGVSLIATAACCGEFTLEKTISAEKLTISNLIGEITVLPADGDDFLVEIMVAGEDADADLIGIDLKQGDDAVLRVQFPIEEHRKYVYPPLGRGKAKISPDRNKGSILDKLMGLTRQVRVAGRGDGLKIWADVVVRVPRGGSLEFYNGVGEMSAKGIEGDVLLDGSLGEVVVEDIKGDVGVDTGSGSVSATQIRGRLNVDTGSGSVRISEVEGVVLVDTGSGSVEGVGLNCKKLVVDTGSGSIILHQAGAEGMRLDTGSGDVEVELVRMGSGGFAVDTGSGSVRILLPDNASVRIEADTGSGGIKWDLKDVQVKHRESDEVLLVVGGGDADLVVDTGSGSIRISQ